MTVTDRRGRRTPAPRRPEADASWAWRPDARKLTAEFVGTAFLVAAVVGSGIMAETLTDDVGLQLLQNAFASTSFANPAVTIARMFSDTFAGIEPSSAPAFVLAQLVGTAVAITVIRGIYPDIAEVADQVVVPHGDGAGHGGTASTGD